MDTPRDEIYETFARAGGKGIVIAHGVPGARFLFKILPLRLYILAEGEPQGEHLLDCFREAVATGRLVRVATLVDLRRFTGSVDWDAVRQLREMAPPFENNKAYVAYVVRDDLFGKLIKIAAAMFPNLGHKVFYDPAEAAAWLDQFDQ